MKRLALLLFFLAFSLPAFAAEEAVPPGQADPVVVGNWFVKHPDWFGTLQFRADGTFSHIQGEGGRWETIGDDEKLLLKLKWDGWNMETLKMVSVNRFTGAKPNGTIVMRRLVGDSAAPPRRELPAAPPENFVDPKLKARLDESSWLQQDGKVFTLHADGSTKGDWHARKGAWKIVAPNQIELTINWKPQEAVTVTVEGNGSLLRWSDDAWGKLAKRIDFAPEEP